MVWRGARPGTRPMSHSRTSAASGELNARVSMLKAIPNRARVCGPSQPASTFNALRPATYTLAVWIITPEVASRWLTRRPASTPGIGSASAWV